MFFNWRSLVAARVKQTKARRQPDCPAMPVQIEHLEPRTLLTSLLFDEGHDGAFLDKYGDLTWAEDDLAAEPDSGLGTGSTPESGVISGSDDISDVNDGTYDLSKTFSLQSNVGSNFTIYLDFNGHVTSGTYWNSGYNGGNDIITQAWSQDADRSSFSVSEQQMIQRIWSAVAEDFAPFDVNVTTIDPGTEALRNTGGGDTQWGARVVIGPNSFFSPSGGVAFIGSFDWGTDTPSFVFNSSEVGVREAVSHEVGHMLGLVHDGTSSVSYFSGHGSGATSWSPIMGVGYYTTVSQWSSGEYDNANNFEDDLTIITTTNGFGYRADDIGNTAGTSTALTTNSLSVSGQGLIERNTDIDYFSFTTGTGNVSIDIDNVVFGANLDILANLYDSSGNLVATSNPSSSLDASFNLSLSAGTYYITVEGTGTGDLSTGYSDYASLGNYWLSGTVAATAPNQDPVANDDSGTTNEDNAILISVMTNDTDADGNTLTLTGTTNGTNGTVTIVNGQVRYTPNANYYGTDTFTYTISDGNGGSSTATVTVTVVAVPETSTVTGPSSSTTDSTPTITWSNQADADHYEVLVYSLSTGSMVANNANATGTSYTVGSNLNTGDYQVYVRAVNAGGQAGAWGMRTFTVAVTTPGNVTITGPEGSTTDTTPTITWNAATNADHYEILVYSSTLGQLIGSNANVSGTSFTPSSAWADDSYIVYLRAVSSTSTAGSWSSQTFSINNSVTPGNVTLTGPLGSTTDTTPTITWNAATNTDHYEILVYSTTQGQLIANSSNVNGTSYTPSSAWADDSYIVYLRAVSSTSTASSWSSLSFSINNSVTPGNVTITGPVGSTTDTTPTITWNVATNADHYEILVYSSTLGQLITSNPNVSGTSFTPGSAWANDNYSVFIRAVSSTGTSGSWGSHSFTVGISATPGTVTVTGPNGTTTDSTPTITWNADSNSSNYQVLVYSISRGQLVAAGTFSSTSATISSPLAGDNYRVYIRGINSVGTTGAWSAHDFTVAASSQLEEAEFLDMFWELSFSNDTAQETAGLWTV